MIASVKIWTYCLLFFAAYGSEIGNSINSFGNKLYDVTSSDYDNFAFSPFSIHSVLSLVHQGAADKTALSFRRILNLPEGQNNTAKMYKILIDYVLRSPFVDILIANKIYLKDGYRMKSDFRYTAENFFGTEVENVDFRRNDFAVALINSWVGRKTRNRITQLIKPNDLDPWATRAVLLNAVYFKGNWSLPFNDYFTREQIFHVSDTESVKCQMMYNEDDFEYGEIRRLRSKVLKLRYKDDRFSMVIVLPEPEIDLNALEQRLFHIDVSTMDTQPRKVAVFLPKFKIETVLHLEEPLKQIGLANIFSSNANFSNMIASDENFPIRKVIQKVFIEVSEEGTEAAAATALEVVQLSLGPPVPLFKANRPFMFYIIVDESNGKCVSCSTVLFMGKVVRPKFS